MKAGTMIGVGGGGGWTGALAGWRRGVLEARLQPLLKDTATA